MVASLFLSRVLGFAREAVIAGKFGQTALTDAYYASFQIPDLLFYLIAGGALSSAFIPVFTEYLHTDREDDAWHVFSVIITVMSLVVLAFIVFAWIYAVPLVHAFAQKLPAESVPLAARMSRIIVPAQYAFFIGGVLLGTLYARKVFSVPGLAPNIYNLGIIIGALVVSNFVVPGVVGMSWGALVGAFVGNIVIPFAVVRRMGLKFRASFDLRHEGVKKVIALMGPVVLGLSLPGVFTMVIRNFASYYPKGAIAVMSNANQLMQVPLGVFGQALALAAFPALSQFFAQKRMDMFSDQMAKSLRMVLFLAVPASLLLIVMPHPVVRAVFERGMFTPADSQRTASALQMFGLGVVGWCVQPMLMRAYFSIQKTWPPVLMGTATTVLFATACYVLAESGYGLISIPIAASVAAIFLAIVMLIAVDRTICNIDLPGIGSTLLKSAAAGALAVAVCYGILVLSAPLAGRFHNFGLMAVLALAMLIAAWVYYFVAKALKMPETETIKRAVKKS